MLVRLDEPMARHTTMGVGGPAAAFVTPGGADELAHALRAFRRAGARTFVLGCGSNLVVSDDGYDGVIVSTAGLRRASVDGDALTCEAGVPLPQAAGIACRAGLSGLEFAAGIPGSVGGACAMNAGAYGGCMADVVESVDAIDADGRIVTLSAGELGFGYRRSAILDDGLVVVRARLSLSPDSHEAIRSRMVANAERRRSSQPSGRSAGSAFKRPGGDVPAARLIDEAGLRGYAVGGAKVSEVHAGFVVNAGGATAADVRAVIGHVADEVRARFGVELEPEIRFLG